VRIAVASSDGLVVNQHFGRADTFYIYDKKNGRSEFVEKRKGIPFCHGGNHEEADLLDALHLLADCSRVAAVQIGKGAQEELVLNGIQPVIVRGIIAEVLEGVD
jgi:predicted Fe-Mo cluster-binding NifX family protein